MIRILKQITYSTSGNMSLMVKKLIAICGFLIVSALVQAEVATDGSVGPALNLSGPQYHIGQELGTRLDANLFHSFSHFNLNSQESAIFTGDSTIKNVISRVTGGESSHIDGLLKSEIGQAAIYFINPAGIVFGNHAQVDVPGAFYASTAGELQFADGSRFSAVHPQASTLTVAAPDAFNFLGQQTGAIIINADGLAFTPGTTVQLSANRLSLNQTKVSGEGIDLQLAAVGNAEQTVGVAALPDHALSGQLTLKQTALDASGNGKGRIAARAGAMNVVDSTAFADNLGNIDMPADQGIDIQAATLRLNGGVISSDALAMGKAGTVAISAQDQLAVINGGQIHSHTYATGDAGQVVVTSGRAGAVTAQGKLVVANGGKILSHTFAEGNAGQVTVGAQNSLIIRGGEIDSSTAAQGNAGDVNVSSQGKLAVTNGGWVTSNTYGQGNAGQLDISAHNKLAVVSGGGITSSTYAGGNAGNVAVKAGGLRIDSKNSNGYTSEIVSSALEGSSGHVGTVAITAKHKLAVVNGGEIISFTKSSGDAGDIKIRAGSILMDGQGSKIPTGIAANAEPGSSGQAGNVTIKTQNELKMVNGSQISSSTFGQGDAGQLKIKAGTLWLDNQGSVIPTSIATSTEPGASGHAGKVTIAVQDELVVVNGAEIQSGSFSSGNAGKVNIQAKTIQVDGQGSEYFTGIASSASSNSSGNAGEVTVNAQDKLTLINGGQVQSSTFAKGNAGQIKVQAGTIWLDGQNSKDATGVASTAEENASGNSGSILINAKNELAVVNGAQITTSTYGEGNAGQVKVRAGTIRLDGQESKYFNGISSAADKGSSGHAGNVIVSAQRELVLTTGGEITSSTNSLGDAGQVNVQAETISIDGHDSGITSGATDGASGSVGSVKVNATKVVKMDHQGLIAISSQVTSTNPELQTLNQIAINAPSIELSGKSQITAASTGNIPASAITINANQLSLDDSSKISTSANQGNGGPVTINSNDWLQLRDSQITTSVSGKENGNGGNISINADVVIMDTGFIQANTAAKAAEGGNINMNIKQLVTSSTRLINGGDQPLNFSSGRTGYNVIQAAAPDGVSGNISISSPQLNIVGALVGLKTPRIDLDRIGYDPCSSAVQQSTIKNLGKGGVPAFNKGQDDYTIDRLLNSPPTEHNTVPSADLQTVKHECSSAREPQLRKSTDKS